MGEQLGMDLGERAPALEPDTADVRAELEDVLARVRAGMDARALAYQRVVFPQMCRWLPEDDAGPLLAAFEREAAVQ